MEKELEKQYLETLGKAKTIVELNQIRFNNTDVISYLKSKYINSKILLVNNKFVFVLFNNTVYVVWAKDMEFITPYVIGQKTEQYVLMKELYTIKEVNNMIKTKEAKVV